MNSALKWLAMIAGVLCIAIGLAHVVLGTGAVPGIGDANATAESEDRFYGAGNSHSRLRAGRTSSLSG